MKTKSKEWEYVKLAKDKKGRVVRKVYTSKGKLKYVTDPDKNIFNKSIKGNKIKKIW